MMIKESEADKAMAWGLSVVVNGIDGEITGRLIERKRFKGARIPFFRFQPTRRTTDGPAEIWVHPKDIKQVRK